MKDVIFVTGNQKKAEYFSKMVGVDVPHMKLDVDEIQSTDLVEIITHKAKQAYEQAQRPVIVEDTRLSFNALGGLPGPFVKWFLDTLGDEGLCRLLDSYDDRSAVAGAAMAYYDGSLLEVFEKELPGTIADKPKGSNGFGWNRIFIPAGSTITLGEMTDDAFKKQYCKIKPFDELSAFLKSRT